MAGFQGHGYFGLSTWGFLELKRQEIIYDAICNLDSKTGIEIDCPLVRGHRHVLLNHVNPFSFVIVSLLSAACLFIDCMHLRFRIYVRQQVVHNFCYALRSRAKILPRFSLSHDGERSCLSEIYRRPLSCRGRRD